MTAFASCRFSTHPLYSRIVPSAAVAAGREGTPEAG
jgi:hypothetical protein